MLEEVRNEQRHGRAPCSFFAKQCLPGGTASATASGNSMRNGRAIALF